MTAKKVLAVSTDPILEAIDISTLVSGVYLVEVHTQNGNTLMQKVIK
ncbi:MAG: T9SS type A sorting domain-containing protein [Flavobacteriaceae bacterium]